MAKRRRDEPEMMSIEFLEGDLGEEFDVDFGAAKPSAPPRQPGTTTSRRWWALAGVVVGVFTLVAVGATLGSGEESASPTTSSTEPTTTTSTTVAPPTTVTQPDLIFEPLPPITLVPSTFPPFVPIERPATSLVEVPEGVRALGSAAAGTTLYVWDTVTGPAALMAYDVDSGTLTPVDLGAVGGPLRSVIPTPFGPVVDAGEIIMSSAGGPVVVGWGDVSITDFSRSGPRIALGPGGKVWVRTLGPPSLALFDPESHRNEGRYELPLGAELIGATIEGRPVVRGPDLQSFQIVEDGTNLPLTEGITTPVENGRYAEVTCAPAADCLVTLHGGLLSTVFGYPVPENLDRTAVRFAPVGNHVAIAIDDDVRILDTIDGSSTEVPLSFIPTGDAVNRPAANYFRIARDLVWTPGGEALGFLTPEGIVFVGLDGAPIGSLVLDPEDPLRYVPLAMG